jgi:23S rRNA pseudouridine1911/1915/1917 synthase
VALPDPDILLEEGACLVLNKPGGLLTQGPPGIDSLELRMKSFLKIRDEKPGKVYLGVPHRLDRPVSGVIVVVKNVRAAKRISTQFQERTVVKKYWTVVEGDPGKDEGTWTDWMRKIPDQAKSEISKEGEPGAKHAILKFKKIATTGDSSFLEIELETGRTHQIRIQCASRGFPIIGDALYGSENEFGPNTDDLRKRWIALHARRLGFSHPIAKTPVDVTAPLPEHWNTFEQFRDSFAEDSFAEDSFAANTSTRKAKISDRADSSDTDNTAAPTQDSEAR